jgi:hypothetical protein
LKRLVQVREENAPVGQDDVDPVQGREVGMRHVELLDAKESRKGFEAVAVRKACERRALQAHG